MKTFTLKEASEQLIEAMKINSQLPIGLSIMQINSELNAQLKHLPCIGWKFNPQKGVFDFWIESLTFDIYRYEVEPSI